MKALEKGVIQSDQEAKRKPFIHSFIHLFIRTVTLWPELIGELVSRLEE